MKLTPGGREERGKDTLGCGFTFHYPALISLVTK